MAPELMFLSERASQLSKTASKVQCMAITLHFSYVQPVTQRYKRRTVLELPLQSVQSPRKIRMIPVL